MPHISHKGWYVSENADFSKGHHLQLHHTHTLILIDKVLPQCTFYNHITLCKFSRLVSEFCLSSYRKKPELGRSNWILVRMGIKLGRWQGFCCCYCCYLKKKKIQLFCIFCLSFLYFFQLHLVGIIKDKEPQTNPMCSCLHTYAKYLSSQLFKQ